MSNPRPAAEYEAAFQAFIKKEHELHMNRQAAKPRAASHIIHRAMIAKKPQNLTTIHEIGITAAREIKSWQKVAKSTEDQAATKIAEAWAAVAAEAEQAKKDWRK